MRFFQWFSWVYIIILPPNGQENHDCRFDTQPNERDAPINSPAVEVVPSQNESLLDSFLNIEQGRSLELETRARRLLSNPKFITWAPGLDETSFLVASESRTSVHHHVTINLKTGQVACETKSCLPYKRAKICHHTIVVAVAKKANYMFAVWHNKQKMDSGLDKIVSFELPKGTGQKAHNRTRRRFGTSEKTAQVATVKSKEGTNTFFAPSNLSHDQKSSSLALRIPPKFLLMLQEKYWPIAKQQISARRKKARRKRIWRSLCHTLISFSFFWTAMVPWKNVSDVVANLGQTLFIRNPQLILL